ELDPLKSGADRPGQCLRQRRLTNSGDIFDQQMTAREQACDCEFDRLDFADNNLTNLRGERIDLRLHTQQSSESDDPANAGRCEIRSQRYKGVRGELV